MVDDTVTEIMHAAKEEAAAAAQLSNPPDSKMEEKEEAVKEGEVPTEAANEADVKEAEEHDGIHTAFHNRHIISQIQDRLQALNLLLSHH